MSTTTTTRSANGGEVLRYTAFSHNPGGGNPAGVVLNASDFTDDDMLRTAAEVGFSETAFLVPGEAIPCGTGRQLALRAAAGAPKKPAGGRLSGPPQGGVPPLTPRVGAAVPPPQGCAAAVVCGARGARVARAMTTRATAKRPVATAKTSR